MKSVLIIEDNPQIRENTAELLRLQGYRVQTAANGNQGYSITTRDPHPDIILCDVLMPETGGLDFLSMVKANPETSSIPLIFFSAGSAPLSVKKQIETGADHYLQKPFSAEQLASVISKF